MFKIFEKLDLVFSQPILNHQLTAINCYFIGKLYNCSLTFVLNYGNTFTLAVVLLNSEIEV